MIHTSQPPANRARLILCIVVVSLGITTGILVALFVQHYCKIDSASIAGLPFESAITIDRTRPRIAWVTGADCESQFAELASRSDIEELYINSDTADSSSAAPLMHLKELRVLHVLGRRFDGDMLKMAGKMKSLEVLVVHSRCVGDDGVRELRALSALKVLDLGYTSISDESISYIAELPSLTTLNLSGTKVTDRGLQCLSGLSELHVLWVASTRVDGEFICSISACKNLRELDISHTDITFANAFELQRLPSLQLLRMEGVDLDAAQIATLRETLSGVAVEASMATVVELPPPPPVTSGE